MHYDSQDTEGTDSVSNGISREYPCPFEVVASMSVEETLQPSFTVTADIQPRTTDVSQGSRAIESLNSYANQSLGLPNIKASTHEGTETDSGSLPRLFTSQEKEGVVGRTAVAEDAGTNGGKGEVRGDNGDDQSQLVSSGNGDASRQSASPGPDITTTPVESTTKGSEGENIPSPVNTPPGRSKSTSPPIVPASQIRAATQQGVDLQPINRYSPHKANFINPPPPLSSTKRSLFGRQRKSVVEEKDSFVEDDAKLQKQVRPVEKLKRMMERYDSTRSGDVSGDGFSLGELGVPAWEGSEMQAEESLAATAQEAVSKMIAATEKPGPDEEQDSSPSREAHKSPESNDPPRPSMTTSPRVRDRSPSLASSNNSRTSAQSPLPRHDGFNTLIESESSLGMPSEPNFTQEDEIESQHSTHTIPNVATQSLNHRQSYLSSPPPSPRESDPRSHPSTVSTHPNGQSAKGTTQEATQIVTEDELMGPSVPGSPPTFPARRALPTARARLAGRDVISQPADRSRLESAALQGPHTIAAPGIGRLLARITPVQPPVLEETFVDVDSQRAEEERSGDVDMELSEHMDEPNLSIDHDDPQPSVHHETNSPVMAAPPVEATYVDPTLTSLPSPPLKRPTPVKYGARAMPLAPAIPTSPIPVATPGGLATPPPTAGPSKSPHASPSNSPEDQPAPTKSGRIPKRKRRDSSASMSSSSSSSEDIDIHDESYRPAVTAKPAVLKFKGKGKATHPNLKRLKQGNRSRSSSHTTSVSASKEATATERSTPLTDESDPEPAPKLPERPWVLACWYPNWFIGRVRGISQGKYDVDYEDGTHSLVAVDRVRKGILEIGDKIKSEDHKGEEFTVVEEWNGDERGIKVKGQTKLLQLSRVYIRQAVIKADFFNRVVTPQDLGIDYKPPIAPKPSMNTSTKPITTTSDIFVGKTFFITSTSSASAANKNNQKDAAAQITRNGGKFVEKWYDLFDLPQSGFGSTLASTSAPFLIQETSQASLTPKALVSLAKGIPCLSMAYVEDVIADPSVSPPFLPA